MSSPRMKLPSIAELTSATTPKTAPVSPPQIADTSRNSILFSDARRPSISASSTSSMSPGSASPQTHNYMAPHVSPSYTQYSYGLESRSNPPIYQNFSPQFYMQPAGMPPMAPQGPMFSSVHGQTASYNVPEVINKPMNECHRCGTTETPEWRRGPNGLRTLCNACGLFHAKLVKKKGAALAAAEVLNNKVYKGKNGRRVRAKKADSFVTKPSVVDFPPIHQTQLPTIEPQIHTMPTELENLHHVPRYQQPIHPHALPASYKPHAPFLPAFSQYSRPHMVMSPPHQMPYPEMSMAGLRH